MCKARKYGTVFCLLFVYNISAITEYDAWKERCAKLPRQRYSSHRPGTTPLDAEEFLRTVYAFKELMMHQLDDYAWRTPRQQRVTAFTPYVQKLALDEGAVCAFHGDLHGDIHAFNDFITVLTNLGYLGGDDGFTIIDDNFYMIFLGDYVDRGWYGAEVIYTIVRLKLANPERVILIRGNHEDVSLNNRYGFEKELRTKFPHFTKHDMQAVYDIYEYMPVALFLGSKKTEEYILCCHGGIEVGYDPRALLADPRSNLLQEIQRLEQVDHISSLPTDVQAHFSLMLDYFANFVPKSPTRPHHLGFMWNDFMTQSGEPYLSYKKGRGFKFGKKTTTGILKHLYSSSLARVMAIFRAHQHGDKKMMASILNTDGKSPNDDTGISKLWRPLSMYFTSGKLWQGIVCTFLVSPGSYGAAYDYAYDAFGLLHMNGKFNNWKLDVVRM
jgi:hypothetical protein